MVHIFPIWAKGMFTTVMMAVVTCFMAVAVAEAWAGAVAVMVAVVVAVVIVVRA